MPYDVAVADTNLIVRRIRVGVQCAPALTIKCVILCLVFLCVVLRMISGNTMKPIGTFYIGVNGAKKTGIITPGERRKAMEIVYGKL